MSCTTYPPAAHQTDPLLRSLLRPPPNDVVKRCSCKVEYTAASWAALKSLGIQECAGPRLDLRNCPNCRSTMALPIDSDGVFR